MRGHIHLNKDKNIAKLQYAKYMNYCDSTCIYKQALVMTLTCKDRLNKINLIHQVMAERNQRRFILFMQRKDLAKKYLTKSLKHVYMTCKKHFNNFNSTSKMKEKNTVL